MGPKGKRKDLPGPSGSPKKSFGSGSGKVSNEESNGLVFEDPFGDEFEEEEYDDAAIEKEQAGYSDEEDGTANGMDADVEDEDEEDEHEEDEDEGAKQIWRPGIDRLEEGETLEYDPSAYTMYHSLTTEWPCLSFDLVKDTFGETRHRFPLSMVLVTGSQADRSDNNKITLLKLTDLHRTGGVEGHSDDEDDDDEHLDEDPILEHVNAPHTGGVNRIRSCPQIPGIIASMADNKRVNIYNFQDTLASMMSSISGNRVAPQSPAYTYNGHTQEGYAIDWSKVTTGRLATGDCNGDIIIWNIQDSSQASNATLWNIDNTPYRGHTSSVEDLQWSPTENTVFASASADNTVRIWDTRGRTGPQITVNAHDNDVNVISWNPRVGYLLASGCDDGSFKVWDLRSVRDGQPLANFTYHNNYVTSLEWAPHDESVLCVSSADNQVTIWDLSVEADDENITQNTDPALNDFPPQLLFIHQGQNNVKEVHWHPQIPGVVVTTAEDSFNVFKPAISVS
jgi:ribosome assembly protein RRB1